MVDGDVVDWDGDGVEELATFHPEHDSYNLSVYKVSRDGQFESIYEASLPRDFFLSSSMVAKDWDGDGDVDLVVGSGTLLFFEQLENGSLIERTGDSNPLPNITATGSGTLSPEVGDWNGDGRLDLLVADTFGAIRFFERSEDGGLEERRGEQNPFGNLGVLSPDHPELVDWDADGDLDLLVIDASRGSLHYFERLADGGLELREGIASPFHGLDALHGLGTSIVAAGNPTTRHEVADLDGDGQLDLLFFPYARFPGCFERAFVRRNGTLLTKRPEALTATAAAEISTDYCFVRAVEWEQDRIPYFVRRNENGSVSFLKRTKDAGLLELPGEKNPFANITLPADVDLSFVDADGDGDLDVFVANGLGAIDFYQRDGGRLRRRWGLDDPLRGANVSSLDGIYGSFYGVKVADWNQDGLLDIVVYDWAFQFYEGLGNGTFMRAPTWEAVPNEAFGGWWPARHSRWSDDGCMRFVDVEILDWNRDGAPDLLLSLSEPWDAMLSEVHLVIGGASKTELLLSLHGYYYRGIMAVDWDGDGDADLFAERILYEKGACDASQACNGKGLCTATTGQCSCIMGHNSSSGDCSLCSAGYYSPARTSPRVRECTACPATADGFCAGRGFCFDDRLALRWAAAISVAASQLPMVQGNGTCHCNEQTFSGDACGEGGCGPGYELVLGDGRGEAVTRTCRPCAGGSFLDTFGNCAPCGAGTWSGNASSECQACPKDLWRYTSHEGSTACFVDYLHAFPVAALFAAWLGLLACGSLLLYAVPIEDIRMERGRVMVTTHGPHRLLAYLGSRSVVRFFATGVPWLDAAAAGGGYAVSVLGRDRFYLLKPEGDFVTVRTDASVGTVRMSCWRALFCTGFWHVPVAAYFIAFAVAATYLVSNQVSWRLASLEGLLAVLVAALRARLARSGATELARSRERFLRRLREQTPQPVACPRGAGRALTAGQLCDFFEFFAGFIIDRSMYYVCESLIKPLTEPVRLSYAELAGPRRVVWFVSHFWGTPFLRFVDTLREHACSVASDAVWRSQAYWVCSFSNSQWAVKEELGQGVLEQSSFYLALHGRSCRGTVMVIDDEQASPLQRAWCLFEVLQTMALSRDSEGFRGLLLGTPTGLLNEGKAGSDVAMAIARRLATLDLRDAGASCKEDQQMIHSRVESMPGGFDAVNGFVRNAIYRCLMLAQDRFKEDFDALVEVLKSSIPGEPRQALPEPSQPSRGQDSASLDESLSRAATSSGHSGSCEETDGDLEAPGAKPRQPSSWLGTMVRWSPRTFGA